MLHPRDVLSTTGSPVLGAGDEIESHNVGMSRNQEVANSHRGMCRVQSAARNIVMQDMGRRQVEVSTPELETFFRIEFVLCQASVRVGYTRTPRFIRLLQNVIFWGLLIMSLCDVFGQLRSRLRETTEAKEMLKYTELGFIAVVLLTRLYFVKLLLMNWKNVEATFASLRDLEMCQVQAQGRPTKRANFSLLVIVLGVIPLLSAILWGLFGFWQLNQWSMSNRLYEKAVELAMVFIGWGRNEPEKEIAKIQRDVLDKSYTLWMGLGTLGILGRSSKTLMDYAIRNLMLALAWSLSRHSNALRCIFARRHRRNVCEPLRQDQAGRIKDIWSYYFQVRKTSQLLNKVFGVIMKLTHACNVMTLMYFVLLVVTSSHTTVSFCIFLYDASLILTINFVGAQIARVNDAARSWIKHNTVAMSAGDVVVDGTTLQVLLDDIRQNPIGIGTGTFFMAENFIQRFIGLVTSLLFYMLDSEEATSGEDEQ